MPRSTGPVGRASGFLIELDRESGLPLHEQIERSVREAIRGGRLAAGARLPSTRALAEQLGVSRGVVSEAFGQLAAEGYLLTRQGAPITVSRAVRGEPRSQARSLLPSFTYDFDPGRPDLAGFPRDRWLRSLRAAWRQLPLDAVGYPDPRGAPALRESLADYLRRVRGTASDAERIVVCTGFTQAFSMTCRWLREQGIERIALEDPGWHRHRLIVEQTGLEVVPVPVDEEGLRVDLLAASEAAAVVVTPAHQFPTGAVLDSGRRTELIEWAESGERLIVEDDFDAEYRYDGPGVGALQGLAPERVAYIGSASKRLVPGMRLGWLLAPSWLAWPLITAKAIEDGGSEVVGQLALHDFIERGELDRHIRRMRRRYRLRREALGEAVARLLPEVDLGAGAAGLFEPAALPPGTDESAVIRRAAERGVGLEGLATHRFRAGGDPGLVLGFGDLAEPAIEQGVRLIAASLAAGQG